MVKHAEVDDVRGFSTNGRPFEKSNVASLKLYDLYVVRMIVRE